MSAKMTAKIGHTESRGKNIFVLPGHNNKNGTEFEEEKGAKVWKKKKQNIANLLLIFLVIIKIVRTRSVR